MEIIDKQNRYVLSEGRNSGIGFAFLKRLDSEKYETVQPFSPCKDYLNEVVFTEKYNVPTKAHGLNYPKKLNIFTEVGYLGFKIMVSKQNNYGFNTKGVDSDIENLNSNFHNIQLFLNLIEDKLGINPSLIKKVDSNLYIVQLDTKWIISTPTISLYTLLLRIAQYYDGDSDIINFIEKYSKETTTQDKSLATALLPKFTTILDKGILPPQPKFSLPPVDKPYTSSPHGYGIIGFNMNELTE